MKASAINQIMKMETYAKFPYLIEITHYKNDGTSEIYRFVNSDEDVTFEGNTYEASYFEITPPEKDSETISDAKIKISAVDQEWIRKIRETQNRSVIRFVAVIIYNDDNNISCIETIEDIDFELSKASWNDVEIEWSMEFDNLLDVNIPIDEMDTLNCPILG